MAQNQFSVGDEVVKKGSKKPVMKIVSNVPAGLDAKDKISFEKYLSTNKFRCEWRENGVLKNGNFDGDDLEDYSPTFMSYENFHDLNTGINPTSKWEIVEAVKAGKIYIVDYFGEQYAVETDKDENLILTKI